MGQPNQAEGAPSQKQEGSGGSEAKSNWLYWGHKAYWMGGVGSPVTAPHSTAVFRQRWTVGNAVQSLQCQRRYLVGHVLQSGSDSQLPAAVGTATRV